MAMAFGVAALGAFVRMNVSKVSYFMRFKKCFLGDFIDDDFDI